VTALKRPSSRVAIATLLLLTILTWHAESTAGQLTASWVNNTSDAIGLSVERSTGSTGTFTEVTTTGPTVTTYSDPAVSDGTTYCYRVRAYNPTAYSDYSNTACGTTAQAISLAVVMTGTGSGVVISAPSGILCGTTCSGPYGSGTAVTLTATAATGSTFTGWSGGGCTGTGTCTVTMTSTTTVTATFNASPVGLTVSKAGTGSGSVSSTPAGITCGTTCSATYPYGTAVTLTAVTSTSSTFTGWSGACTGTGPCSVTLTSAATVTATFTQPTQTQSQTLTVSASGKGTVTSSPAGINCGKTCSATYPSGTAVTLTATPGAGFAFSGWSGACTGTGSCAVSMTTAQSVTATFRNMPGKR
jgi:Divergent InlB B-repeat domain